MAKKDLRQAISGIISSIHDQHTDSWSDLKGTIKQTESLLKSVKELKKTLQQKTELNKEIRAQGKREDTQDSLKEKVYERKTDLDLAVNKLESRIAGYENRIKDVEKALKKDDDWDSKWKGVWPAQKTGSGKELDKIRKSFQLLKNQKIQELDAIKKEGASDEIQLRKLEAYGKKFDKSRSIIAEKLDAWDRDMDKFLGIPAVLSEPYKPYTAALPQKVTSGDLHLGKELGKGSFGEVYKLKDVDDAPPMAFKYFKNQAGDVDEEELQREIFCYEAVGEHPNIAKCFGRQTVGGKDGMVMELMEGGTLSDVFKKLSEAKKKGEVSQTEYWAATQHMMKGLLQALAHMEKVGFVHSDLKPGNIGFSKDFETKVFDLGAGGGIGDEFKAGTVEYADLSLMKNLDPAYDIFGTGHMIHELMEGKIFSYRADIPQGPYARFALMYRGADYMKDFNNRVLLELDDPQELQRKLKELDTDLGRKLKELKTRAERGELSKEQAQKEGITLMKERDEKVMEWWEAHAGQYNEYQSEYVKFLNNLMHPDPTQRMTAAQALEHPFMKMSLMETDKQRDQIFGKLLPGLAKPGTDAEPKDAPAKHKPDSGKVEDLVFESGLEGSSPKMQKTMKEIGRKETQKGMETRTKAMVKEALKDFEAWKKKADKISRVPKGDPFKTILSKLGDKDWKKNDGKRKTLEDKIDMMLTMRDLAEGWYDLQGREGVDTPDKEKGMTRKERIDKGLGLYKSDKEVETALLSLRELIGKHNSDLRETLLMWEGFEENK